MIQWSNRLQITQHFVNSVEEPRILDTVLPFLNKSFWVVIGIVEFTWVDRYPHLQNIVVFSFADHCVVLTVAGAAREHMRLTLMLFLRDLTRSRGRGSAVTTRALSRGEQRIGGSSNTVYIAVSSRQIRFHETQMLDDFTYIYIYTLLEFIFW